MDNPPGKATPHLNVVLPERSPCFYLTRLLESHTFYLMPNQAELTPGALVPVPIFQPDPRQSVASVPSAFYSSQNQPLLHLPSPAIRNTTYVSRFLPRPAQNVSKISTFHPLFPALPSDPSTFSHFLAFLHHLPHLTCLSHPPYRTHLPNKTLSLF